MFRPGALVLDPSALPRRLGARYGPADLYCPGFASTPGHLVSHRGRREGGPHMPPGSELAELTECVYFTSQHLLPGAHFLPSE